MKILRVAGWILLALIGLAVVLYAIGAAVNWRDQPPSAAALTMKKIQTDRAPVADADNGFVFAMGFSVPESEDPQAAGALRTAWIEAVNRDPKQIDADPVKKDVDFNASTSRSMERLAQNCHEQTVECRDAFVGAVTQPRLALEEHQLARYRALLQRPSWREVVPLDIRVPMARFAHILAGQRLLFADLGARAKTAPPSQIAEDLRADFRFWREVQKSSDYLITKMLAVAALRQHFFLGNLVLREMPAGQAEAIAPWTVAFSAEDFSMRRVMAGELAFAEGNMRLWMQGADKQLIIDPNDPRLSVTGNIAAVLARPYYQPQDQLNHFAAAYLDLADRFAVPLERYSEVEASFEEVQSGISFGVYNLTGNVLRGLTGVWTFISYPMRVGSIEGMRRAALLTVQLRERGVTPDAMQAELNAAALRDPFDNEPFEWDADEGAVVYSGPVAEGSRYWHPYFY